MWGGHVSEELCDAFDFPLAMGGKLLIYNRNFIPWTGQGAWH
jgi:hypothetical protein